jgi:hypothetical protein
MMTGIYALNGLSILGPVADVSFVAQTKARLIEAMRACPQK